MLTRLENKIRSLLLSVSAPAPVRRFWETRLGPWATLALVLAGLLFIGSLFMFSGTANVAEVRQGKAVAAVYGTVSVEPSEQVMLKAKTPGTLTELKVKEGDGVKKDQVLAALVDESLVRQIDLATKQLEQSKIKQSLGPGSAPDLKSKQDELTRLKPLLDLNNISRAEYDRVANEVDALKTKVKNEEIALEQEVQNAQLKLKDLQVAQTEATLLAPIDGKVLNVYADLGQAVEGGTQIIRLGSSANQITASVNEEDVGSLLPGQRAMVRFYSRPGQDSPARLLKVLPKTINQNYQVTFELEKPIPGLLPGMTGEMNIVTGERENALLIPTRAIRNGNKVLEVSGGRVKERTIEVGFRGVETSEVRQGLTVGALVIVEKHDLFEPGMWVRVNRVDIKK
jgi:RND family efflux transporter MFP subunit